MITIRDTLDEKIVIAGVVNEIAIACRRLTQVCRELEIEDEHRTVRDVAYLAASALREEIEILRGVEDKIPVACRYIRPMAIVNTIYEDWFDILSVCLNQLRSCVIDLLTVHFAMLRRGELNLANTLYASSERVDGWASEIETVVIGMATVCDEQ